MRTYTNVTDNTYKQKRELIYADLSFLVNGVLFSTHNELGPFAREKQYADVVARIFREKDVPYQQEVAIGDSGNIVDGIVSNKIILEFKAKRIITKEDYFQTQRYLQESGLELAILVNFRNKFIKPKRIVRIEQWQRSH